MDDAKMRDIEETYRRCVELIEKHGIKIKTSYAQKIRAELGKPNANGDILPGGDAMQWTVLRMPERPINVTFHIAKNRTKEPRRPSRCDAMAHNFALMYEGSEKRCDTVRGLPRGDLFMIAGNTSVCRPGYLAPTCQVGTPIDFQSKVPTAALKLDQRMLSHRAMFSDFYAQRTYMPVATNSLEHRIMSEQLPTPSEPEPVPPTRPEARFDFDSYNGVKKSDDFYIEPSPGPVNFDRYNGLVRPPRRVPGWNGSKPRI